MKELPLQEIISTSEVVVHPGRYAYLKCQEVPQGEHFLVSRDVDEITVVTEEEKVSEVPHTEITRWFKLFEIRVSTPFEGKGFLAKIASVIAEQDLNILLVSTYSKDYALVREEGAEKAIAALQAIGFPFKA